MSEADRKIIDEGKERWKQCEDAESEQRNKSLEDVKFCDEDDGQWDGSILQQRKLQGRPSLTINTTQQFVKQVVNDIRQNMPSIHVAPVEDSDEETADIFEGLCRSIQVRSKAEVAYDTAVTHAVKGGFGFIRVGTKYEDDNSFNQDICIWRVPNQFAVSIDPTSTEPDGSDAMFAFIVDDVRRSDFKRQYPKSQYVTSGSFDMSGNDEPGWMNDNFIRIAEYFCVEEEEETIYLMANGVVATQEDYDAFKEAGGMEEPQSERKRTNRKIMWYKMTATEILERQEWPGKYIPIVPVYGEENYINGKRDLVGLVRRMKDPQRMYNYWTSAQTEAIALAPKAPFVAAIGQIEGVENIWASANVQNYSVLPYNPIDINGTALPPPQRQQAEPAVQTMVQAIGQASEDMKRTAGIYDASLGSRSNENSGKAILARQKQGDTANFHFVDNLSRSIEQVGRILIDLIPKIYDAPRIIRTLGIDGEAKTVAINGAQPPANGLDRVFDLTTGKYDVVVETGPSYNTKREAAAAAMVEISQANPQLWQTAGDLLVKNFDWPGAQELSERLKKTIPPELLQDDKEKQLPPKVQAQMQQAQQMIDALTAKVNDLQDQSDAKQADNASKERIATQNNETKLLLAAFQQESAANMQMLTSAINDIKVTMQQQRAQDAAIQQPETEPTAQPLM